MRPFLTLVLLTALMLSSIAMGSPEKWILLAIGASWAPLLTLILVPLLTRRPLMRLTFLRQGTWG
jgi:heme exporter protein D